MWWENAWLLAVALGYAGVVATAIAYRIVRHYRRTT